MAVDALLEQLAKRIKLAEDALKDAEKIVRLGEDAGLDMSEQRLDLDRRKREVEMMKAALEEAAAGE